MAKLSSAESVLEKISEIEDRIIDLFEAVDHVKKIEVDLSSFREKAQGQAVQLEGMISLGKDRVREIEAYRDSANKTVDETKAYYVKVKARIDKAIELIISGKEDLITLRKAVNEAIRSLADFKEGAEVELGQKGLDLEGKVGDFIAAAEERILVSISKGIAKARQDLSDDLNKKIDNFISRQNTLAENLNHRIDAVQGLVSGMRLGLERVEENQKKIARAVSNHKAHIDRIHQKIREQGEEISLLEKSLKDAEEGLEQMQQRKRALWPFGRKT